MSCKLILIQLFSNTMSYAQRAQARVFSTASVSKTREFKVYSNCKEFVDDFATEKILSAVLIKLQPDDESVYVCYENKDKNWFLLDKKSDSKMKMDAQDSISIMRLYRYLKKT